MGTKMFAVAVFDTNSVTKAAIVLSTKFKSHKGSAPKALRY